MTRTQNMELLDKLLEVHREKVLAPGHERFYKLELQIADLKLVILDLMREDPQDDEKTEARVIDIVNQDSFFK